MDKGTAVVLVIFAICSLVVTGVFYKVYTVLEGVDDVIYPAGSPGHPLVFTNRGEIRFFDSDGDLKGFGGPVGSDPAWSPDGTLIAFSRSNKDPGVQPLNWGSTLFVMNADGSNIRQLTFGDYQDWNPAWSPDGQYIAFSSNRDDSERRIYVMNADGSNIRQIGDVPGSSPAWSPDGQHIAFTSKWDNPNELPWIYVMNADGTNAHQVGELPGWDPAWSPDSKQIAFISKSADINVMNADGTNSRRLTFSGQANWDPAWSPDGLQIAFECVGQYDEQYEQLYATNESIPTICVMNADGTNIRTINNKISARDPAWRP